MDPQISEHLKKSIRKPSFFDKFKSALFPLRLSRAEIKSMQKTLIDNGFPIIQQYWTEEKKRDQSGSGIIEDFAIKVYDKRVLSLPQKELMELYETFMDLQNAKSQESKEFFYFRFVMTINGDYALYGWFRTMLYHHYFKRR